MSVAPIPHSPPAPTDNMRGAFSTVSGKLWNGPQLLRQPLPNCNLLVLPRQD